MFTKELYLERRKKLIELIKSENYVLLIGGFESSRETFRQDSTFYYFSGIEEPGAMLLFNSEDTLFIPNLKDRKNWIISEIDFYAIEPKDLGFNFIEKLGEQYKTYFATPFFSEGEYKNLLKQIKNILKDNKKIYIVTDTVEQKFIFNRLCKFIPNLKENIIDASSFVGDLRRDKSKNEIELIYKAIEITAMSFEAASNIIAPEKKEFEVQAGIEYIYTTSGSKKAFPSIVASGKNSTVLHYTLNNRTLKDGDLVVIDIGAEYNYYCADLTRTFPVNGKFSKRQKEVYKMVLEAQKFIEEILSPGYYITNNEMPSKSLNHIVREFFKERGYEKYFTHGIGHFLGLDVHDVGDYKKPLKAGDVITVEPGIYIPEENIGIRIEDDFWIIEDGSICLSQDLVKQPEEIEDLMKQEIF